MLGSVPQSPRWHLWNNAETNGTVHFAARVSWDSNVTHTAYGTFYDNYKLLDGTPGRNTLTVGQQYLYYRRPNSSNWAVQVNDTFTNVGAPAFNPFTEGQTVFTATGNCPTSWQSHGFASILMPVWTNGNLVVGRTYRIVRYQTGDNFTNVANVL
ncbi:MAG: hypothetical protein N2035_08945 [Chthoniobacterales bacterium]|nr:hypothetical protein [Chthoniobacterales bacterium]